MKSEKTEALTVVSLCSASRTGSCCPDERKHRDPGAGEAPHRVMSTVAKQPLPAGWTRSKSIRSTCSSGRAQWTFSCPGQSESSRWRKIPKTGQRPEKRESPTVLLSIEDLNLVTCTNCPAACFYFEQQNIILL